MKKVKLLLDDLHVESFSVNPDFQGLGTVWGREYDAAASGVHSQCLSHCPGCPNELESVVATHCDLDCPSWDGSCGGPTRGGEAFLADCGGTAIEV